jgi:dihydropyrimidinase
MELLIKNPTIVTSTRTFQGDILIAEGKIKAIGENLNLNLIDVIDASGKILFPGGIDPHVHMHLPTPAGFSSDDFFSGSKAALYGGTTTIIDFVTPNKGQSLVDALNQRIEEAKNSLVDYSFHVSPVEWRHTTEQEIHKCVMRGFPSFKIYMAYKAAIGLNDDVILKVMQAVAKAGGMVTVHAEMGDEIELLRNKFFDEGETEPLFHLLSRPPKTESDAVKRVIEMANTSRCPLYIVHVSTKESLVHIQNAQAGGQIVFAETCPHYLLLNDSAFEGPFEKTAPFVLSPPLRKDSDSLALWNAIDHGVVKTIGTDHCPFSLIQKEFGKNDFRKIPNGAGGVEHRMELLYTFGVLEKRISINQFVDITSTQPAKIFGLYPRKGEIAIGSDADLVIWDPNIHGKISSKTHHSACDISIYEGYDVVGKAEFVIKSGKVVDFNKDICKDFSGCLLSRK